MKKIRQKTKSDYIKNVVNNLFRKTAADVDANIFNFYISFYFDFSLYGDFLIYILNNFIIWLFPNNFILNFLIFIIQ